MLIVTTMACFARRRSLQELHLSGSRAADNILGVVFYIMLYHSSLYHIA